MRPAGGGPGEGAQQWAALMLFVLLLVFFALAIRTEWDRRRGEKVPEWSEVLERTRTRRRGAQVSLPRETPQPRPVRQNDVI